MYTFSRITYRLLCMSYRIEYDTAVLPYSEDCMNRYFPVLLLLLPTPAVLAYAFVMYENSDGRTCCPEGFSQPQNRFQLS